MLIITDAGEKIITEALTEYKNAADEMRPCCARALVAKLETVIALAKEAEDPLRFRTFTTNGITISEYATTPVADVRKEGKAEDISNIDSSEEPLVIKVKKMRDQKKTISQIASDLHIPEKQVRDLIKYKRDMDSK